MKQQQVLAQRYAQALFALAQDANQTDAIDEELRHLSDLLDANESLQRVFTNPVHSLEERQGVLRAIAEKAGWTTHLTNFLLLLAEKGRTSLIGPIQQAFSALADAHKKRLHVNLVAATTLSDDYIQQLKTQLHRQTGKEILLEVDTDKELMGGIVMRIGDKMLDATVASRLNQMKERMLQELQQS